jgi:adenylate cyclase
MRAAISMINALDELNRLRLSRGQKPILMGIGLNTDTIVSGNIGSPKRMDFTVIGDGVNLASRLESACKEYSARILASEATVRKLKGSYCMREIDLVVVKGKNEPVSIYVILDFHDDETFPNLPEVVDHFKAGLKYYRSGEFDRAIRQFNGALELNPDDRLSGTYVARCEYLMGHPPEGAWDGVWVMKSK